VAHFRRQPTLRHGLAGRALENPLTELALSLGYSWIESAVMAGVKLVLWTTGGPAFDYCACDRYAQGLAQALATPDASLGSATPLAAIASARHETQYSRLFRS
jgi:urease accessory protein